MNIEKCDIGFIESCDVPSVYSNKQSYYEVLCYINHKINEVINKYNNIELDYRTYVDAEIAEQAKITSGYVDSEITKVRNYAMNYSNINLDTAKRYTDIRESAMRLDISKNTSDIRDLKSRADQHEKDITRIERESKERDVALDLSIQKLEADISTKLALLKVYIDDTDVINRQYTQRELESLKTWVTRHYGDTYTIENPWRGYKTNLQTCIDDIFAVYRPLSMSCTELETIIPDIIYIDSENLSCGDFDFNGLRVRQYLSDAYMHSPVSGRYIKLQDVISELVTSIARETQGYLFPTFDTINSLTKIDEKLSQDLINYYDNILTHNSVYDFDVIPFNAIGSVQITDGEKYRTSID